MSDSGYYRMPAIGGNTVYFVSEDDLWAVPSAGGPARRLTSGMGTSSYPAVSPDGRWLAFSSSEEGSAEVYVMASEGGHPRRLTYTGKPCAVVCWTGSDHELPNHVVYASAARQPFLPPHLNAVAFESGQSTALELGPAEYYCPAPNGRGAVLARVAVDAAHWKRYRGGTAGDLWIDPDGGGKWRRLIALEGNPSRPLWIGSRIYFISDHEGVSNLYSCTPGGEDLRRHSAHEDFYARGAASDGRRIVYHAGADLFLFDPASGARPRKIEVEYLSPRTQRNRKFVDAGAHLEFYCLHPREESIAVTARGKAAAFDHWEGPVRQLGEPASGRHRLAVWLCDGERIATVYDAEGEETLAIHRAGDPLATDYLRGLDIGRVTTIEASPVDDRVALTNVRNELVLVDLKQRSARVLDRGRWAPMLGCSFSPDGKWLAYRWDASERTAIVRLCRLEDGQTFNLTRPVLADFAPVFDPEGNYLYFLSARVFNPVYDKLHFELGFPKGIRPYLVTLRNDVPTPFGPGRGKRHPSKDPQPPQPAPFAIDLEGIEDRIQAFPVPEAIYQQIDAIKGKVLFSSIPIEGSLDLQFLAAGGEPPAKARLEAFDLESGKLETWADAITSFVVSTGSERLAYRAGNHIRVVKTTEKPNLHPAREIGRDSGWIDLGRVKLSIDPPAEWRQMYREAWRLQREQYWVEDMAEVDWQAIHDRYLPLLDRLGSRGEFEDLLWEMQGELGASHAYAYGGDFRREPRYPLGFLGADFAWDDAAAGWRISHIVRGDPWDERSAPPLMRPGVNLGQGALITAVNNRALGRNLSPEQMLVHQAGAEVVLTVVDRTGAPPREVVVKAAAEDALMRYREWVERNREWVHERSGNRCGYVHIPDMGPWGFAEFHRLYLAELDRDGLVIDVRYNRGGHVSSLLLEKLARKRLGYQHSRWFGIQPWPDDSPAGPMVAVTNQHAGSDGDIFSQNFKAMKLGPLLGKRTWGGVIGIWPRHLLADGGLTTQPEFAFWFEGQGWAVENYGVTPDIEVEYPPHDYHSGRDPQLERAVAELIAIVEQRPSPRPQFEPRPSRAPIRRR